MYVQDLARRIWARPWLVLGYMALVAGANGAAARIAVGEVSPLCLVFLRWFVVCFTLTLLLTRDHWIELKALIRDHAWRLTWMGVLGYAGFNSLFYVAAYHTSAINLTLLQSSIPALVLAGSALVFRTRIRWLQIAGMVLTFLGVLVISAKGDLSRLSALRLDAGDAAVLLACLFYAIYALGLRSRPPSTPLVFFTGMAIASLAVSIPMAGAEIAMGNAYWPSLKGWLVMLFIAFGPSFSGQLCFMRGVDLIGPARAGLTANFIPIFGAFCAVIVLHERFTTAHVIALLLGLGGISLAEWPGPRRRLNVERSVSAGDAGLP
jgi:drug/metabolite transporter (DMT)-like permease